MLHARCGLVASALLIGLGVTVLAPDARARGGDAKEQAAMAGAKITKQQAMVIAEKATGGKAIKAGVENEGGVVSYEVKIDLAGVRKEVLVDMQTGRVIKVSADEDNEAGAENETEGAEGPKAMDDGPARRPDGKKKG